MWNQINNSIDPIILDNDEFDWYNIISLSHRIKNY